MIVIRDPSAVNGITDPDIRSLVSQRMEEMCDGEEFDPDINGYMVVVEPGDSIPALEHESGCPILGGLSPCFEVLEEYPACYEMVFIPSDGDFGICIFIPKQSGIDAGLLSLCEQYAVPAPELV